MFLYNPCADENEIEHFRDLARSCLRRHVITPYKKLPQGELFSVVTFGCRLALGSVYGFEGEIVDYLRVGYNYFSIFFF